MGRKTRQMSIILKIEKANDKNNKQIKQNADLVIAECKELYQPKIDGMKTDDYREWMFANHPKQAEYFYDEMGKPNNKGISKPIMGQHKKNIFGGIKTIATDNEAFLNWAQSDIGNEVSSLAKVTASINKYAKSIEPKTETQNASDEAIEKVA